MKLSLAMLISLAAICMAAEGGVGAAQDKGMDKGKVYRDLRARYDKLSTKERGTAEGRHQREQLSEACGELIERELPAGTPEAKVRETLGPPSGEIGAALLYPGKTKSVFHKIVIADGKISKYAYGIIWDLER